MRAIRELRPALAIPLLVLVGATFFGGGFSARMLPWWGGAAVITLAVLVARLGPPGGWIALAPIAALALWCALSISWSTLPDRSWDYANRTAVYAAFVGIGLYLWDRTRELAYALSALLAGIAVWALAGKVLPWLYEDYGRIARLRAPVGYWNALALLGVFALPLALWLARQRRTEGVLLAYAWLVVIGLTYSRSGVILGALVIVAWAVLSRDWLDAAATTIAAAVPAFVVFGIALALPGVTDDGQSHPTRVQHGLLFGLALVAGGVAAVALSRAPRPAPTLRVRTALIGVVVAIALLAVVGTALAPECSNDVVNTAGRFGCGSTNHRADWWREALDGFRDHPLAGSGAGSFVVTHLRLRGSFLDETPEPHNVPLQFLTETGIVGFALYLLSAFVLLRGVRGRRDHELALALIPVAFFVHGLVDIDWDYLAVAAPAFLVAGALAGRPRTAEEPSPFPALAAAGVTVAVCASLLLPWLADRWTSQAEGAVVDRPAHAIALAKRARSANPLSIDPILVQALGEDVRGRPRYELGLLEKATEVQPDNKESWFRLGDFWLNDRRCARRALPALERVVTLDPQARPSQGGDEYRRALALVNSGKPKC
jgi:hypothetical protein